MKKILLTGGNGFFCTRFTKRYRNSYDIISTDVNNLDITDHDKVIKVIKEVNPDYVIHAAAVASTEFCDNNPRIAHKINVQGAINVAHACKLINAKMIFISSEQVFNGNIESGPYSEDHTPKPNTVYGKTKLEAEIRLKEIIDELWILRFTWLFGIPEKNCTMTSNILWNTISIALKGEKTKITCNEYRGLTYVYDVIDQIPKIFDIPYGTYHIGSHNDLNRYEVSSLILKEIGLESKIDDLIDIDNEKYKDHPRDIRLCTDKIKSFGLEFLDTKDAIKKCIKESNFKI